MVLKQGTLNTNYFCMLTGSDEKRDSYEPNNQNQLPSSLAESLHRFCPNSFKRCFKSRIQPINIFYVLPYAPTSDLSTGNIILSTPSGRRLS